MSAEKFFHFIKNNCFGRHINADSERFGGEDQLDEFGGEHLFHRLLERRQKARVVVGDAVQDQAPHVDGAGLMG